MEIQDADTPSITKKKNKKVRACVVSATKLTTLLRIRTNQPREREIQRESGAFYMGYVGGTLDGQDLFASLIVLIGFHQVSTTRLLSAKLRTVTD